MSFFTIPGSTRSSPNASARKKAQESTRTSSNMASEWMKKTNFDRYLEEQLKDPDFAQRFKAAGEAWDIALQITRLREEAGVSQKELAERLDTAQQQISRPPAYEGHSLSILRRVAASRASKTVSFDYSPFRCSLALTTPARAPFCRRSGLLSNAYASVLTGLPGTSRPRGAHWQHSTFCRRMNLRISGLNESIGQETQLDRSRSASRSRMVFGSRHR